MKKKFFLLAIALGLWGLNANAQSATTVVDSGNCGPTDNETAVTWKLTSDSVMTISGTGAMQDYGLLTDRPWHSHSTRIKTLVVNEGITALGLGTFMRFANLTSVTLPNTLTTIGTSAFNACNNLPEITIPDKVTSVGNSAFASSKLTSITFPRKVTSIGNGALANCANLKSVFILSTTPPTLGSTTSLGSTASTRVYVPNSSLAAYQQAWSDLSATLVGTVASGDGKDGDWSWVIGSDSVLIISGTGKTSDYTAAGGIVPWYNHRLKVKTAVVETGITRLGTHLFYNHTNLTSVSLPSTLTRIDQYVFRNCSKLLSVALPTSLTLLNNYAFEGSGLTSIHIPAGVTTISNAAFYDAESLATLTVAAGNTAYTAEGNVLYNKDKTTLHTWPGGIPYVEVYTLPETVTGILSLAFRNAKIGYLVLHDGMTTGAVPYGLSTCRHIQGVTLPSNATALQVGVLQSAPLRSVTLPSSITSLSNSSLAYLTYLRRLISLPTTPPTAQSNTFTATSTLIPCYVPSGSVSAYQAANYWKSFTNIIGIVANGTCGDGLTWVLGADSTLVISGYGNMENYTSTSIPWIANRAGIKKVVVEDFVTSIGDYAFHNMPNLSSVELGDRVLTIGEEAFNSCTNLSEITIPASVAAIGAKAFANTGLTRITAMPVTPPSAEENTFTGVPADIELVVPDESVDAYSKAIGWSDFGNHTSILGRGVCGLKAEWQLTDDGIMRVYGSGTMSSNSSNGMPWRDLRDQIRTLVVEEDISMIGSYAFQNCDSLTTVTLPSTLKRIAAYAFQDCDNLDLTLPDGITIIDAYAFYNCFKLTTTLPSTLADLGTRAFQGTAVASAHIPAGLTTIGDAPFADCQNLTAITVAADNPRWTAQDGVLYDKNMTQLRQYPVGKTDAEFKVPDGVTAILAHSFFGNAHLKAVSLPDGLTTINASAFYRCPGLEAVNIPEGVTVLNNSVFYGCPLRSVTLPSTLKNINASAFGECSRIESIVSLAATPPTVGNSNVFFLVSKMVPVYVPSANVDAYKAANIWKDFKNIVGIQGSGACGDGLTWTLGADSVLVITGSGEMADYALSGASAAPWNAQAAAIKAINLGAGVSKLGTYAFAGCTNVKAMYADATTPPAMTDANSVSGLPSGMPVYVPTGSVDAYKAADNWKSMNIQGMIAHGKCGDNLTWTLTAAPDTTLTISGTGAMWNASETSTNFAPWYGYLDNIKSIVVNEGVTTIGASVFRYCQNMTSLSLPSTLTSIATYAFFMCRSIESITIPEGVTRIEGLAFSNCHSLKNLVLPSTWENVSSDGSFAACYSLESFVLPNDTAAGDLRVIDGVLFSKDSTILRYYPAGRRGTYRVPDYVKTLYTSSFRAVSASRVEINDSVSLSSNVFYYCDSLRTVRLPRDMKALPGSTFCYADSLETLTIPAGMTAIGPHSIRCTGLRSLVMLPANPPTVGQYAFSDTPRDIPVYVHASSLAAYQAADSWDEFTNYVAYKAAGFCGYDLLWMVMPDSTLVLSGYGDMDDFTEAEPAPWSNMDISRVKIGANVTGIGQMAFAGCTRLAAIELEEGNTAFVVKDSVLYTADGSTIVAYPAAKPQTKFETGAEVTTIASYAFAAATNLTELELTAGVSRIGEGAFSGCTNIATIVSRPTTPPTIADNTFSGVDKSIPVYVYSLNDYEEAEHWKDFFENFQPIPGTGLAVVEQLEGVHVVNGRVMVYGYTGRISVFDVSGRCVLTTTDSSFELPQGAYLLRAGNAAAKVLVP